MDQQNNKLSILSPSEERATDIMGQLPSDIAKSFLNKTIQEYQSEKTAYNKFSVAMAYIGYGKSVLREVAEENKNKDKYTSNNPEDPIYTRLLDLALALRKNH